MEVLGNNNRLKNPESQASGSNYICRMPQDLNLGSTSIARSKGEIDVGLLIACKAQLSSEVIKWKTESLRLQKERDSALQQVKDLDQLVAKISGRSKELESMLLVTKEENEELKAKTLSVSKDDALQKLTCSLDKFHSFPWSETPTKTNAIFLSHHNTPKLKKIENPPQEDWKEVSQKLLEQMKQEMKELQELSNHFSIQEKENDQTDSSHQEQADFLDCDEKIENDITSLVHETESLKTLLLEQRRKLQTLMKNIIQNNPCITKDIDFKTVTKSSELSNDDKSKHLSKSTKHYVGKFSRPSDESFRDYFTKQLGGLHGKSEQDMDKMAKAMQLFLQSGERQNIPKNFSSNTEQKNVAGISSKFKSDRNTETEVTMAEEERVCPICQKPFGVLVPQKEFEEHVMDHLEVESASLLDQYVVL